MSAQQTENQDAFPTADDIAAKLDRLREVEQPRYRRLWAYFRNPMRIVGRRDGDRDRPYRQAQEWGLPSRITGMACGSDIFRGAALDEVARKEVVIENDIAWRMDAMVDYLFGQAIVIQSTAADPGRRELIGDLLRQILAHNGGILFLQQLALLGTVYGFVDVLVKFCGGKSATTNTLPSHTAACGTQELGQPPAGTAEKSTGRERDGVRPSAGSAGAGGVSERAGLASEEDSRAAGLASAASVLDEPRIRAASDNSQRAAFERLARMVRLEIVEPARALPFLSSLDYREVVAYGQVQDVAGTEAVGEGASDRRSWLDRLLRRGSRNLLPPRSDDAPVLVEMITANSWCRYENGKIVAEGRNSLGRVPLVHIQNTAVPFSYSGASEVEPLIPLQDELNTRLSDRAHRITMQSFKMYLGKAIENFDKLPVAPGRMWVSDDPGAGVIEFGGDAASPSEDAHLEDIRDAIDKASGVTPIAAGVIKDKIGNLTSAAALRVTLQALIAKTEKRRTCYGMAIGQMCELALAWLDRAGLFATSPEERAIQISWPSPLPENELDKLTEAEAKVRIGVPKDVVLRELGY